ncbi:CHRD domain-containing protein [Hyalangium versicolor]|uniref:CHRD domain-containing protein n=1 Tax=Hyalangium versicolor TaxID=2861190 RepID=UPI001CD021C1|nr:CHRD domain-containing protein [Hyalangium versicolor]
MKANRLFIACVAALSLAACGGGTEYSATLSGGAEKPNPIATSATGTVKVTVGDKIEVEGNFSGLTANASKAHIHGPAGADGIGVVYCDLNVPSGTSGEIKAGEGAGSCADKEPTEDEKKYFEDGKMYVNIHSKKDAVTDANGEIRGDLKKKD